MILHVRKSCRQGLDHEGPEQIKSFQWASDIPSREADYCLPLCIKQFLKYITRQTDSLSLCSSALYVEFCAFNMCSLCILNLLGSDINPKRQRFRDSFLLFTGLCHIQLLTLVQTINPFALFYKAASKVSYQLYSSLHCSVRSSYPLLMGRF